MLFPIADRRRGLVRFGFGLRLLLETISGAVDPGRTGAVDDGEPEGRGGVREVQPIKRQGDCKRKMVLIV